MAFVVRKRQQVDGINEMSKDKRPTERIIWWGTPEEIEAWIEKVYGNKGKEKDEVTFVIREEDIE